MSSMSINLVLAILIAFVVSANGNPIENIDEHDIIVCPEGGDKCEGYL